MRNAVDDMLRELIQRSDHRVILDQCQCRQGNGRKDYPKDIGCIYIGEATQDSDPSIARHALVEEALEKDGTKITDQTTKKMI